MTYQYVGPVDVLILRDNKSNNVTFPCFLEVKRLYRLVNVFCLRVKFLNLEFGYLISEQMDIMLSG